MTLSNKTRKRIFIFWFVWGPLWILILLYDLIQNWHAISNFKLIFWPLQIISISVLIFVFYQEYRKLDSNKPG